MAETSAAATTAFDLDLRAPLATILGDGTRRYLPGDPAAGYEQAGAWSSALADQLGSAHSFVSDSGVQGAISRWDPYGGPRPGSTATAGIGYGGEWRDPAGLIDLRARAYDPALGRFTSRDAFGGLGLAPQTANRYSYALNGPYRYADPSGRFVAAVVANAPMLLSIAIQSTPVVGDAYSALTGLIGYDPIAGVALSDAERGLALASAAVIGGGFHLLARLGDGVADGARLGRVGDGAGEAGVRGSLRFIMLDSSTARALSSSDQSVAGVIAPQLRGANLYMTRTANREFMSAVGRLAGPSERRNAADLLARVRIVPDNPSDRVARLTITRSVREADIAIFGTADRMGIPIYTSDARFVRGARAQGVELDAIVHDPMSFVGR